MNFKGRVRRRGGEGPGQNDGVGDVRNLPETDGRGEAPQAQLCLERVHYGKDGRRKGRRTRDYNGRNVERSIPDGTLKRMEDGREEARGLERMEHGGIL